MHTEIAIATLSPTQTRWSEPQMSLGLKINWTNVGSTPSSMRCETAVGMAQAVRREILRQARTSSVDGEPLVDLAQRDPFAASGEK